MVSNAVHLPPEPLLGFALPCPTVPDTGPDAQQALIMACGGATVDWQGLAPHIAFDATGYRRVRLYEDADWEMLLLCWLPGQATPIHDHGRSWGVTLILAGDLHETRYTRTSDEAAIVLSGESQVSASAILVETTATIHRVSNRSTAPALSLHFYCGPLRDTWTYCPETGQRQTWRL